MSQLAICKDESQLSAYADAGMGNTEKLAAEDTAVPQLKFLQQLSKECDEVPGAKAGLIFNTVTQESVESLLFVNCHFSKQFSIFRKREIGGGIAGNVNSEEEAHLFMEETALNPAEHEIKETHVHRGIIIDEQGTPISPAVIYLQDTKIRASKTWNAEIQSKLFANNAPRYAAAWVISTAKNKNNKGTWYTPQISFAGVLPPDSAIVKTAKSMNENMSK